MFKLLFKTFEAKKVAKAQVMVDAKANKPRRKLTTANKKLYFLIDDNDIKVEDAQVTQKIDEPNGPLDMPRNVKPSKKKHRMAGPIHIRH